MSNTREKGYWAGFNDASAGMSRQPKREFSLLKSLIFPKYVETYCAGYAHGYNTAMLKQRRQREADILKKSAYLQTEQSNSVKKKRLQEIEQIKKGMSKEIDMRR